ncbi:hypothetical protein [Nocardia canadensis]|uniref:hypothetical protein n=1 Tax=Nocardia canadensis TaxID=3065238 RepID=UPI00292D1579|nr:hypothetical protein [Nocardia canadensis]
MARQFPVAFGDGLAQRVRCHPRIWLCDLELRQGVFDAFGGEDLGEPLVQGADEEVLLEKDVRRVFETVRDSVFAGIAAAVDRRVVKPVALHLAPATVV